MEMDAERVAGMEFPMATDGYDKQAVRNFLAELAEEIRAFRRANTANSRRAALAADEVRATVNGLMAVAESLENELTALGDDLRIGSRKIAGNIRDLQRRMNRRLSSAGERLGPVEKDPLDELCKSIDQHERPV